jgi:hypothetical protein
MGVMQGVTLAATSTATGAASTPTNGADSTMVNIMGGAAALGLAVLAL